MPITRRTLLTAAAASALAPVAARADEDTRKTERSFGHPDAPVTVMEFFSMTCTHCAAFSRETMPEVIPKLVDTGKVRFVYHDFPLDKIALTAAAVARALPPERYEPFCATLFASQDRWAFARGANITEELWKRAALAGLSRDLFDQTVADEGLKNWILEQQEADQKKYAIDSTPTFIIGDRKHAGAMGYDAFAQFVGTAASG